MTTPYPPAGGQSSIAITTKFFPLAFLLLLFKPRIAINGQELPPQGWGRVAVPVTPGNYNVHVHVPYLIPSKIGKADLALSVAPGQNVELEYRAPMWVISGGSLGAPPQKYNGMVPMIVITAVALLLVICSCALPLLTGGTGS